MARRTCVRCYAVKAKCQPGRGADTCRACEPLGHDCETARSVRKIGRPRATRSICWDALDSESTIDSSGSTTTESPSRISTSKTMPDTPEPEPQARFPSLLQGPSPSPPSASHSHTPPKNPRIPLLKNPFHPALNHQALLRELMQHPLQAQFFVSPEILLDGFLACAGEFARLSSHHCLAGTPLASVSSLSLSLADDSESQRKKNITRSTTAPHKLGLFHPTDIRTVSTMLALGTSILTNDQLASLEGASMVCGYLLSQVKPWYARLVQYPDLHFELNCLISGYGRLCIAAGGSRFGVNGETGGRC
jgi:hypothetical protein